MGGKEQVLISPFRVWSWNPFKNLTFAACRVTVTQGQTPERIDVSFAYLPLYTGDYQRDTLHLSMLEHGAYLKLLMYCWDQKGPAPHDERKLMGICNARSKEEITAMQCVLTEFFIRMDDGWYNKRLTQELAKAEESVEKAQDRGRKSAEARRQKYGTAQPFETLSKAFRNEPESFPNPPSPSPSPSPSLTKTPEDQKHSRFSARKYLLGKGVPEDEAIDWLRVRKEKKLAPTRAAIDAIEKEAIKGSIDLPKAIHHCCENAWAGFKNSWLEKIKTDEPLDCSIFKD